MVRPRYVIAEAWSIAKSSPRQTVAAITLIALALYVPGLLALLSRNLSRLSTLEAQPIAVVVTLQEQADARALATRLAQDPRIRQVRIVGSEAALERFRRAYPDLGAALAELKEAPFPPSLEVTLRSGAPSKSATEIAGAARLWPGVESAESGEDFERRFRDAVGLMRNAGLFLGVVLTLAAILTVASAVRLALDLHREEVGIMADGRYRERDPRAVLALRHRGGDAGGAIALAYGTYRLRCTGAKTRTRSCPSLGSASGRACARQGRRGPAGSPSGKAAHAA
jgi:cell division protein FtsX